MNIVFKKKNNLIIFNRMKEGETFSFGEKLYIKVSNKEAFCINDNKIVNFSYEVAVFPIMSELVVYTEE